MEFELVQSILTSSIVVIWYFASTLIIFDFLTGLPAFMQQAYVKCTNESIQAVDQEQSMQDTFVEGLNSISTRPVSSVDEATIEYLTMVGADIEDFETVAQARQFLDVNAPWTMEIVPARTEQSTSDADNKAPVQSTTGQEEKLTCVQVQAEFAKLGYFFEKYRTGHNRYRVKVNGLYHRFKTLQDALEWLDVSKRLIQVAAK